MPVLVAVCALPATCASAVSLRQHAKERTRGVVERIVVVVIPNCYSLSGSEFEAEALEDTHAAVSVTLPSLACCLAEIV